MIIKGMNKMRESIYNICKTIFISLSTLAPTNQKGKTKKNPIEIWAKDMYSYFYKIGNINVE